MCGCCGLQVSRRLGHGGKIEEKKVCRQPATLFRIPPTKDRLPGSKIGNGTKLGDFAGTGRQGWVRTLSIHGSMDFYLSRLGSEQIGLFCKTAVSRRRQRLQYVHCYGSFMLDYKEDNLPSF